MIPQIEDYIYNNWNLYYDKKPDTLQSLLLSNPQGKKITHSKCTVLVFKNNEKEPSLVCKYSRVKGNLLDKVVLENSFLKTIGYQVSIPIVYSLDLINDRYVQFEEFKSGNSIKKELVSKINNFSLNHIEDVLETIMLDFQQVNIYYETVFKCLENSPDTHQIQQDYVEKSFSNQNYLVECLNLESRYSTKLLLIIQDYLTKANGSLKPVHFDFTPSNIIRNNDNLFVIDFEFSTLSKHTFCDKFRFLFYYFHACHEARILPYKSYEANFYYFFFENQELKTLILSFCEDICSSQDERAFIEYMTLFLFSNLQLQVEEVDIVSDDFINHTRNLLVMLIDIYMGNNIDTDKLKKNSESEDFDLHIDTIKVELIESRRYISKCNEVIQEKDKQLQDNIQYIERCHATIAEKDKGLAEKDKSLAENLEYIEKCHATIAEKDKGLAENLEYIAQCHATINDKDRQISDNEKDMNQIDAVYQNMLIDFNTLKDQNYHLEQLSKEFGDKNKKQFEEILRLERFNIFSIAKKIKNSFRK